LQSNEVERMVRALAKHKGSSFPAHQQLLQQLQQRVQAEAAKNKEDEQRREARRGERKARVDQLRQDMMMRTPARAPKPAPDLIAHKQQPPVSSSDKSNRGRAESSTPSKNPDEAFLNRFDVKGSLGQGGFGEVLACWDNKLQRRVAVKVVRAESSAREGETARLTQDEMRRLKREALAARRVKHTHCMQCYGFYIAHDQSKFYLLLEFLAGRSLEDILMTGGPMAEVAAVQIIMGTLEGLEAVHTVNLVHRDMKPDNIIMHDRGDGVKIPKIVDFGMTKGLRAPDGKALASQNLFMTEGDMVAGTPEYMSPEQWAGVEKDIDFRSDIWAVGATLYQLLTGRPPFEAPPGQPRRNIIGQVMYDKTPTKDVRLVARQERVAAIKTGRQAPGNISADVAYAVAKSLAKPLPERFSTVSTQRNPQALVVYRPLSEMLIAAQCAEMRGALSSTAAGQRGNAR
jgi:serine/threonine protein kinase